MTRKNNTARRPLKGLGRAAAASLLTLSLLMVPSAQTTYARKTPTASAVTSLIKSYSTYEEFDVVTVGSLGMKLLRVVANAKSDNPDTKKVLDALHKVRKIIMVDYSDCDERVQSQFERKVEKIFGETEKLVEIKSEGERVEIYGMTNKTGEKVRDFIIYVPSSKAMFCALGSVSKTDLGTLVDGVVDDMSD